MTVSEKIETIDKKIEQNKAQYNLYRPTSKISALSSRNVCKYDFLTSKDVLPEKGLLEKAATFKRFEYSLLGKELKAQTDIAKKQYLGDSFEFDKIIKKNNTQKIEQITNLIYESKHNFYPYDKIKNFNSLSLKSKYPIYFSFYSDLSKFNDLNPRKGRTKNKKATVYNNASEIYNDYLKMYFDEYKTLSDTEKEEIG